MSVLPNAGVGEQQDWNKSKKWEMERKQKKDNMEKSTVDIK